MKHFLTTLIISLVCLHNSSAQVQSAYHVYPNPADTTTTADTYDSPAKSKITNISSSPILVKWDRTEVFLSEFVTSAVCDPITCWATTVNTKTFNLGVDSSGQMTVHFYNDKYEPAPGVPGSGIVHVKLTNLGNLADTLTVVYTYNTLTGTGELPAANVRLFPNPTTDFFTLKNAGDVASMRLFSLDGRVLARYDATSDNTYSIAQLPKGNYVLSLEDKNGQLFQAVEIHKQ